MDNPVAPRPVLLRANKNSQVSLSIGPFRMPVRAVICIGATTPLIFILFSIPGQAIIHFIVAAFIVVFAFTIALPEREDVWVGTYLLYRLGEGLMPRAVSSGQVVRARVTRVGQDSVSVVEGGKPLKSLMGVPLGSYANLFDLVRSGEIQDSLFELRPGGWQAMVRVEGPDSPPMTESYQVWQDALVHWMTQIGVPCQIYSRLMHYDRGEAEDKFERGIERGPQIALAEYERGLYGQVAADSIVVNHYVVFMPRMTGNEGNPTYHSPMSLGTVIDSNFLEAKTVLEAAIRLAPTAGIQAEMIGKRDLSLLLDQTVLRATNASMAQGLGKIGGTYTAYGVITTLPNQVWSGGIINALMQNHVKGVVSMHVFPVSDNVARDQLQKQHDFYRYAAERGDAEAGRLLGAVDTMLDALSAGVIGIDRMSITIQVEGQTPKAALDGYEKVKLALAAMGYRLTFITVPGMAAAAAAAPGGVPLARGLILTTDGVVAASVPALGTPMSDQSQALVGRNVGTGSPVYLDLFGKTNFNFLCVGAPGAGKSVSMKTLAVRHILRGSRAIIIDPDSEYGNVVKLFKGVYVELGDVALNPLARPDDLDPDDLAQWMGSVIALLSVMGGEETSYSKDNNMPIRSLGAADKAWLQSQLNGFFALWESTDHPEQTRQQPILSDLIWYLEKYSLEEAKLFKRDARVYEMILRLKSYTQGDKAKIFDRESNIDWNAPVIGIGLRSLAMKYDADMTAALAFALSAIMSQLGSRERIARKEHLIVLVDEAHRVVGDPDAATVLNRLIRQARKYGAGVWLASQSVGDFMAGASDTLAGLIGTKLVLGVEEMSANRVQEFFGLSDRERGYIAPSFQRGRGVLIAGSERAVVFVLPGEHLMPLISTDFAAPARRL